MLYDFQSRVKVPRPCDENLDRCQLSLVAWWLQTPVNVNNPLMSAYMIHISSIRVSVTQLSSITWEIPGRFQNNCVHKWPYHGLAMFRNDCFIFFYLSIYPSPLHTSLRVHLYIHVQVYLLTVCPGKACIDVRTKDVYVRIYKYIFFYQEDAIRDTFGILCFSQFRQQRGRWGVGFHWTNSVTCTIYFRILNNQHLPPKNVLYIALFLKFLSAVWKEPTPSQGEKYDLHMNSRCKSSSCCWGLNMFFRYIKAYFV